MDNELKLKVQKEIDETLLSHGDYLGMIKDRWDSEKEYEDWKDYKKALKERFKEKNIKKVLKVGISYLFEGVLITIKATSKSFKVSYIKQ